MVLLNQHSLVSSIVPDVYISKIVLENTTNSQYEQKENNPHVDVFLTSEKTKDLLTGKLKTPRTPSRYSAKSSTNVPLRTIQEARDSKLLITIELVLKQKLDNDLVGMWLRNNNFSKYLRLKIIQSKSESLTRAIVKNGGSLITNNINSAINSSVEYKILNVQKNIVGDATNLTQQYTEIDEDGNSITNYVFRTSFELLTNSIEHLAYFAFSYIDLSQMAKDFKMKVDSRLPIKPYGKIVSDIVFQNFELVGHSYVFYDKNNKIWVGTINEPSVGEFFGITKNGLQIPIFRKMVGNSKIQDFRDFKDIERLELNFSIVENEILNTKLISARKDQLVDINISNGFFSDMYIARDHDRNSRFLFSIDMRKLLTTYGLYGKLFSSRPELAKTAIFESSIVAMKILRRRVRGSPEIGSKFDISYLFESNQIDELIVISGESSYKNFVNKNSEKASLREIKNVYAQTVDGFQNLSFVRHFTGIDKTIQSVTDGYYIYGVELEISDPSYFFIRKTINHLRRAKEKLQSYYTECIKLDSTKTIVAVDNSHIDFPGETKVDNTTVISGNFNSIMNRFTEKFINEQVKIHSNNINEAPWILAVRTYIELLQIFSSDLDSVSASKYEKSLLYFVHPATGNPSGILKLLKLFEAFETNLIKSVGDSALLTTPNYNLSNPIGTLGYGAGTAVHMHPTLNKKIPAFKTFKVVKFFDSVFNASVPKSIGYDFLDIEDKTNDGLKIITGEEYQQRVDRETNHYFAMPETTKLENIDIHYKGQDYTTGDSIDKTSFSYLTPSKISFGDRFKLNRLGKSPSPIINRTMIASLDTAIKNYNTSTTPIKNTSDSLNKITNNSLRADAKLIHSDVFSIMSKMNIEPVVKFNKLKIPLTNIFSSRHHPRLDKIIDPVVDEQSVCDVDDDTAEELKKSNSTPVLLELAKRLDTQTLNSKQSLLGTNNNNTAGGEKLSIKMFDLSSEKSLISKMIEDGNLHKAESFFQGELHHTSLKDSLIKLPNQIKSLYLARTSPNIVRNNYFNLKTDPLKDTELKSEFRLSYQMINCVQVFSGYRKSIDGEFLLKEPIWLPLTLFIYNQATGGDLICRLKPYENRIIGVIRDKSLELPIYDEYFILSPRKDAVGVEIPEIVKPTVLTSVGPPAIINNPEIEVRSIAPRLPDVTTIKTNISDIIGLQNQSNADLSLQNIEQLYFRTEFISNNLINYNNTDVGSNTVMTENNSKIRNILKGPNRGTGTH